MIEKNIETSKINYWYCFNNEEDGEIFDYIFIDYTDKRIPLTFKFKRHKNFCYYEQIKDFVIRYMLDYNFMLLSAWLNKNAHKMKVMYGSN
jgi:hypothetical protein